MSKAFKQYAEKKHAEFEQGMNYPMPDYSTGKVKLYHGTSTQHLDDIIANGIKPRHGSDSNWSDNPSNPKMVYLSSAYAVYFAQQAAGDEYEPVVFEVLVDTKRLYPDEDYLEQITRHDPAWSELHECMSMEELTAFFRDNLESYQEHYDDSLYKLGNCCHKGVIKPKAIQRYSVLDNREAIKHSDPTITLINFRILGGSYRRLSDIQMWQEPLSVKINATNSDT